jgi:KaiC/GvpD/RAD55 family RecA-like ATPase
MEQVKTGIPGLDEVLDGGLVRNAAVLISGNPGTGKSILCQQFVYNGVEQFDEDGIYLTFEETREDIRQAAESVGLENWGEYVEEGRIKVYDKRDLLQEADFSSTLDTVFDDLSEDRYSRIVIDSLTMFQMFFDDDAERRRYLLKLIDILKENGLTSLLTHEQSALFPRTDIGLENFLTDGNIYLGQTPTRGTRNRFVWVAKMRKQATKSDLFPLEITDAGIEVHPDAADLFGLGNDPMGGGGGDSDPGEFDF